MKSKIEYTISERVQLNSELFFAQVLDEQGLDLEQIKRKMDWESPKCDWALGYLLGVGDIEIVERDGALHIKRKISHYPFVAKAQE